MPVAKKKPVPKKDGFEIIDFETRKVEHFIECTYDGSMREKCEMGLARKVDTDRFFWRDTRDAK